ncbi:MAG: hypothetical protein U0Y68_18675 [Blastocatellia bacterium]
MSELAVAAESIFTLEQKQMAVEAILHSHTFARADQLKSFLKFVCEMELAGRGAELTEYLIGVEALGRAPNYSPGDDSAVRNRAFALRKKLQEYYEQEQPPVPLRIELTKGSYCPHFVANPPAAPPMLTMQESGEESFAPALAPLEVPEAVPLPVTIPTARKSLAQAFLAGVLVTALSAGLVYWLARPKLVVGNATAAIAPILTQAWGPLLAPNADVMVCVANPPSFSLHTQQAVFSNDPNAFRAAPELEHWAKEKFRLLTNAGVTLSTTTNSTYWGDALGAMAALKTFTAAGVSAHIFPEIVTTIPTLRRRNVLLFGAPEYSPLIAHFLEKCPLTVNYLMAVVSHTEKDATPLRYAIKRDPNFRAIEVYGLITVLPSESATSEQHRTVIFSGVNSAGAQAAAEFFASPEHLLELQKHLQQEGHAQFPPAYQVVVKAEPDDNLLLSFKYETASRDSLGH